MVIIIMGVSGSGKTSVGKELSKATGWEFFDGDDFHPKENVAKMRQKIPLTDEDRFPWLARLRSLVEMHISSNKPCIIACSALRKIYREKLCGRLNPVHIVYLKGEFALIEQRMSNRKGHYMPVGLLKSQFGSLEEPDKEEAVILDISKPVSEIVEEIMTLLPH